MKAKEDLTSTRPRNKDCVKSSLLPSEALSGHRALQTLPRVNDDTEGFRGQGGLRELLTIFREMAPSSEWWSR
jgi:hypothetical protein